MTVLVTLTLAGTDVGPFNMYSNSDGYVNAIATGVSRTALVSGYSLTGVPDTASIVRAQSTGTCTNFLDMYLSGGTTTTTSSTSSTTSTTSTPAVACLTGTTSATGSCSGGMSSLFTVSSGHTALITPSGYYFSGTGTRSYQAYIMNAANTTVLHTFYYTQTGSAPGSWSSTFPDNDNILPAGSYRLRTDTVNCFTSSGAFTLTASCNS